MTRKFTHSIPGVWRICRIGRATTASLEFFQLFHFVNFEPYWSNILRFRIVLDQTLAPVPIMSLDGAPHLSGNSPTGVGWRNFYGY